MQRVLTRLGETPVAVFAADWRLVWWNRRLAALIRRMIDGNARFAALWHEGTVAGHTEDRKTIRHPDVGDITVDCDVLHDTDTDLKIVIYTAAPGSEDATTLDLTRVTGSGSPITSRR